MNGVLILNKEKNYTSHDAVYRVRKIVNEKVGHGGTLDPMAEGVLPLLIGKGTACSKYLINHDKIYDVVLQLGKKTDTADSEGKVIENVQVEEQCFENENVKKVLNSFLGISYQIPPMYSAIKVNGKKLYEYARLGEKIEVEPRKINIYEIKCININKDDKQIAFKVKCSKGTYIRSLCENIAEKLGTVGHMKSLKRIQVGDFNIENAITIDELEKNIENKEFIQKHFINIEELFQLNNNLELTDKQLRMFLNGVKIMQKKANGVYRIYNQNIFIGIGIIENELLKRDIIV